MNSEATARKGIQKLQRAIVDGLEEIKALDIQVFNTEHLSPLFERVMIASGTSNRQTKALAASVRDAVRKAGFAKPRTEGEENGEWIIVDCGAAVAHIMQPAIRQYYRLEDIWGDKPVRLKVGARKPPVSTPAEAPKSATQAGPRPLGAAKASPRQKAVAAKALGTAPAAKKTAAAKTPARKAPVKTAASKTVPAKKTVAKKTLAVKKSVTRKISAHGQ